MGVNSLPKTVTRQRRGCDLNPGPTAPESSALTTRLPSHPLGVSVCVSVSVDVLLCRAVSINPAPRRRSMSHPPPAHCRQKSAAVYFTRCTLATRPPHGGSLAAACTTSADECMQPPRYGRAESAPVSYTQGEVTSQSLRSRYDRHFVAIKR